MTGNVDSNHMLLLLTLEATYGALGSNKKVNVLFQILEVF